MRPKIMYPEIERLKHLLSTYFERASVDFDKHILSEKEGDKIFQLIINDYIKGIVSVDDLSFLCEMSYAKIDQNSKLFGLLLSGAEIEWDIRHKPLAALSSIEDLLSRYSDSYSL